MVQGRVAELAKKPVPEALPMKEIVELGQSYRGPEDRALFYFCYLTGARISEALDVTPRDIQESRAKGDRFLTVRLLTRKNRRSPFRDVPVPMEFQEKGMVKSVYDYIGEGGPEKVFAGLSRTNAWNRLSKRNIAVRAVRLGKNREIIPEFSKKVNPHYLRHCRLTHLVQHYGYNELQLMRFAGWSNTAMAIFYVHLNWMDLANVMSQAKNGGWDW